MPARSIADLPTVLTSFGYRSEYLPELESMLATVREHHPGWPQVIGRGPLGGSSGASLSATTPGGEFQWTLPAPLRLDGENDWRLITRMKAWWIATVWNHLSHQGSGAIRLIWLDADARLNGPLDFLVDAGAELIASPWYVDRRYDYKTLTTG